MTALYSNWLSPVVREKAETAFKANSSSVPGQVNLSRAVTGNDYKEAATLYPDGRQKRGAGEGRALGSCPVGPVGSDIPERPPGEAHRVTWKHTGSAQLSAVCDDDLLGCLPTLGAERISIFFTASMPSFTWPNTTCLPSSLGGEVRPSAEKRECCDVTRGHSPLVMELFTENSSSERNSDRKLAQPLTGPVWSLASPPAHTRGRLPPRLCSASPAV